jgi:Ca-activated chloride channel family protein
MLHFEWPWLFALTPLPLFIWWLLPPYRERTHALRMPYFEQMAAATGTTPSSGAVIPRTNWLQKIIAPLCWLLIVAALAKPQWLAPPLEHIEAARDLLLAVDLSQSMETKDFVSPSGQRTDRLSAVKQVIADFIQRRKDDRIGLIVFGNAAFPQAPLTLDHQSVQLLLDETRIGMAGPQTAIGDAIGVAVKLTQESKNNERVLILLTDGNDTASRLPPEEAAKIAQQNHLTVHTIGIGDVQATGENRVDLAALEKISAATHGRSFRGEDRNQLENIYATIDQLTPRKVTRMQYRPKRELYWLPLGASAGLLIFYHVCMLSYGWLSASLRKSTHLASG